MGEEAAWCPPLPPILGAVRKAALQRVTSLLQLPPTCRAVRFSSMRKAAPADTGVAWLAPAPLPALLLLPPPPLLPPTLAGSGCWAVLITSDST
jgi:hypothetical protein